MSIETVAFACEFRHAAEGERIIEGIAVPYGAVSMNTPYPNGERFLPGSLTKTVRDHSRSKRKVKVFRSHQHDRAIGLVEAMDPADPAGLRVQVRIAEGQVGDEVMMEARSGLLDAFSVGFRAIRERIGEGGVRDIVEAALHEVSLVPLGAYDGALVTAVRKPSTLDLSLPPAPVVDPLRGLRAR